MKQKVERFLVAILVIVAIGLLLATASNRGKTPSENDSTSATASTEVLDEGFVIGEQITVLSGTYVFESSVDFGSGKRSVLSSDKVYVINGYSYCRDADGKIQEHDYWEPKELTDIQGRSVQNLEGFALMIHVCEVRENSIRPIGWINSDRIVK